MNYDERIQELGIQLAQPGKPAGVYKPVVQVGQLIYLSGHGPTLPEGKSITGKVGADLTLEQGKEAARATAISLLSTIKHYLGSLNRVKRLVKTMGLVNSATDFHQHPAVINGCSELFAEVFGPDNGLGARSAFGVAAIPANWAVEIEMILEVE